MKLNWQLLTSALSNTLVNYVWPIPRVTSWLRVTFSELCKASFMGFLGLRDSNSSNLITTGGIMKRRVHNGRNTLNRRWFDVDIMSIRRKKNIDQYPLRFKELFRCNLERQKSDVVWTYFVQHSFDGPKCDIISMYLV